ncbi:hypothetical protein ACQPW1_38380 [Nocardia sp. CA-128927]|uniref:hypothetical protein n=1 Tax=Nocardia sp. CA-128927 TaxID=3239975 RepID=UPI003D999AEE
MTKSDPSDKSTPGARSISGPSVSQTDGPWTIEYSWPADTPQGNPWKVVIEPAAGASEEDLAGGIPATLLRRINLTQAAEIRRQREPVSEALNELQWNYRGFRLRELRAEGITDLYLAVLANAYELIVTEGNKSVVPRLGELVGASQETIKMHLKEARRRDLLTTVRGRAGGQVTEKAKEFLRPERKLMSERFQERFPKIRVEAATDDHPMIFELGAESAW